MLRPSDIFIKALNHVYRLIGFYPEHYELHGINRGLINKFGYLRSVRSNKPVDCANSPVPWFTYPAIQFLDSLDLGNVRIFEWGSGNSSAFFAQRCSSIESIESDPCWYEYQSIRLRHNQTITLLDAHSTDYPESILHSIHDEYDLIVIDGVQRARCCEYGLAKLSANGCIILDNSDWYPKICSSLREASFIQIDFHGYGPINSYSWTTSIFYKNLSGQRSLPIVGSRRDSTYKSLAAPFYTAEDDEHIRFLSK